MEKNVPLLKLIHDPWSINYVIVTFYERPSASLLPKQQQYIQPPCETTNEGNNKGIIRVSGEGSAGVKNTLCFFMYSGCIVVVVSFLAAVERCWCS